MPVWRFGVTRKHLDEKLRVKKRRNVSFLGWVFAFLFIWRRSGVFQAHKMYNQKRKLQIGRIVSTCRLTICGTKKVFCKQIHFQLIGKLTLIQRKNISSTCLLLFGNSNLKLKRWWRSAYSKCLFFISSGGKQFWTSSGDSWFVPFHIRCYALLIRRMERLGYLKIGKWHAYPITARASRVTTLKDSLPSVSCAIYSTPLESACAAHSMRAWL